MPFCPWAQATESLGAVSGMSIRLATDHLLETYPPVGPIYFPRMYGRVLKMPVGPGMYEFRATFECGAFCRAHGLLALHQFNTEVNAAGWPYRWLDEGQEEGAAQP